MKRQHVAIIVETSSAYGRAVLDGIGRYVRANDNWSVFFQQWDLFGEVPAWLNRWSGDGIISRVASAKLVRAVKATGVPFVSLSDRQESQIESHVRSDDLAIGREAAKHLRERGFRHFAYCGFSGELWSDRRKTGFTESIQADNGTCVHFESPWAGNETVAWEAEQEQLQHWLTTLNSPIGIMACNDVRARQVLDACISLGISVPEQAAVIGVDNDELLCQFCAPPLSSVIPNAEAVGFHAAEILAAMMKRQPTTEMIVVPPIGISIRQSTDIVAIDNPDIAHALQFIRNHACRGISVQDVVVEVSISRGALERGLRKFIQRTPQQEIRRVQISRVCELLARTDLPAEKIAVMAGFENPEYMYVVFKRLKNMTPGSYREQAKPGLN